MKLVNIDNAPSGSAGALLKSGEILHLARAAQAGTIETWMPNTLQDILNGGDAGLKIVKTIVDRVEKLGAKDLQALRLRGIVTAADTPLQSPIPHPRLVLAAGLAYKSHLAEMAGTPTPAQPTGFIKASGSVTAPGVDVHIPPHAQHHMDYEGELAVVFGKTCHAVSEADAMSYVAGLMVANDISARDWVYPVWEAKAPWEARSTWEVNIMGKQFDGFTPLGPALVTMDEIKDVGALRLTTRLNGKVMQDAEVSDLIFTIGRTIEHFSKWYTFVPGDVLLTGTPAGVGVGRKPPVFMKPGDVIEVEISSLGVLRNTIR